MSNDPSTASQAVLAMADDWDLVESLLGGTKAMRAASQKYLPKWPNETDEGYQSRRSVSTLFPAYRETVSNMTSRVMAEPITLGDDVPAGLKDLTEDIDRQGNNLQVWARDFFFRALGYGLCHALIDYPKAGGVRTKAEEKAAGVRPYAVLIHPKRVLGWKSQNGVLTQFRFSEVVEEEDGAFGSKAVEQVRVLEPGSWSVYRKNDKGEWVLVDSGISTLGVVPVVTYYTNRTGFMQATPPLLDLAHLNVKHWQSQSDQDNILHYARVPLLALIGMDENVDANGKKSEVSISSSAALTLPQGGDAKWVEHSGQAVEAGRNSLKDLVEEMRMAGAKLLQPVATTGSKTATQADHEAETELSPLEAMALSFEDALDQVLQLMAMWRGEPDGGHCEVHGNFEVDYAPEASLTFLLGMANAGKLSNETLFTEAQRRGVISDEVDWQDEQGRLEAQGPDLSGA